MLLGVFTALGNITKNESKRMSNEIATLQEKEDKGELTGQHARDRIKIIKNDQEKLRSNFLTLVKPWLSSETSDSILDKKTSFLLNDVMIGMDLEPKWGMEPKIQTSFNKAMLLTLHSDDKIQQEAAFKILTTLVQEKNYPLSPEIFDRVSNIYDKYMHTLSPRDTIVTQLNRLAAEMESLTQQMDSKESNIENITAQKEQIKTEKKALEEKWATLDQEYDHELKIRESINGIFSHALVNPGILTQDQALQMKTTVQAHANADNTNANTLLQTYYESARDAANLDLQKALSTGQGVDEAKRALESINNEFGTFKAKRTDAQ